VHFDVAADFRRAQLAGIQLCAHSSSCAAWATLKLMPQSALGPLVDSSEERDWTMASGDKNQSWLISWLAAFVTICTVMMPCTSDAAEDKGL
jgi:hypothetical protein